MCTRIRRCPAPHASAFAYHSDECIGRCLVPIVLVALATASNLAQSPDSAVPIDVVVPSPPIAARGAGASHVFYERHITNFGNTAAELKRLEVTAGDDPNRVMGSYAGEEITSRLFRPGAPPTMPDTQIIAAGLRAIVFLQITLEGNRPVPAQLAHRLTFSLRVPDQAPTEQTMSAARVAIGGQRPLVIEPPLRGGDWIALNGPSNTSVHRRPLLTVNGGARIAQRFAIDWLKLGPGGRLARDDRARDENWFTYGEEVLAVADGTVISTKDGIPDNVPLSPTRAAPITLETLGGNMIVLDIGNGRSATYAHLIPKSLRVSVGAKVRRGQVLGLLGNSGNSDAPHLHFHVTDGASACAAEGVPYIFDSAQYRGAASLAKLLGGEPWIPQGGTVVRTREIPMEHAVVRFN
jgi:murein DD-endopeptidase